MTKTIEGIPETITRADYLRLFESVGLTPERVTELSFRPEGIYAKVFERDTEGRKIVDSVEGTCVLSRVFIPIEG